MFARLQRADSNICVQLKLSDHPIEQLIGMSAFMTVAGFAVTGASHILNAQAVHPDGVVFVVECTQSAEAEGWKQSGTADLVFSLLCITNVLF